MEGKINVYVGIDIGAVSIKIALLTNPCNRQAIDAIFTTNRDRFERCDEIDLFGTRLILLLSRYRRIKGDPVAHLIDLLQTILSKLPVKAKIYLTFTGVGGQSLAGKLNASYVNEFIAVANGIGRIHPEVKTVLELGGDSAKYIRIETDHTLKQVGILDYEKNGDCAAGTGSFIDQQATRLLFTIEEIGDIVLGVERTAAIAGRCSVFAKSDMIHAQQKGFKPDEILKGLCQAVVRNFKGSITKGKEIIPPVAFVGGVASNKGIVQAVIDIFQFQANECFVPVYKFWFEAIGSACKSLEMKDGIRTAELQRVISDLSDKTAFASKHVGNPDINFTTTAISSDKVILLRDRVKRYQFIGDNKVPCYLGVDIGSVSTKLVLIDENDELIYEIYTRTNARPIEVVAEGLDKIGRELGDRIQVKGVGTTGSGRELIGVLIGADTIRDEITAHKTGAMNISEKLTHKNVDTIFDIGGQDSKFIAIENGVVVDFTMNEACAAGTGSFLEEQAEKLGINIYNEFSDLALKSDQPVRLGERCTVFMEKDIIPYIQAGVPKMDIAAGLAYSIVYNYLNRVVRGRKIGNTIYFQGGTAYNDSVAGAFATILNKEIIVPPYNGVIGAIGAAILAKETIAGQRATTSFRGFSIGSIDYSLKNFTCKGCSNFCDIQEFTVEGKKTYWGNKCSERFKQNVRATRRPCIGDLIDYRHQLLDEYAHDDDLGRPSVGYIRSMYYYDQYPFWSAYLHELGYRIVLSDKTNRKIINDGVESLISEPCFPISAAHGHVRNLMEKKVDFVLIPNVIDTETSIKNTYSFLCPWGQVLCFFIQNNPKFESLGDRLLMPNLRFYHGRDYIRKRLELLADRLGHSRRRNRLAVAAAFESLDDYRMKLASKGKSILTQLNECGEKAIILLGRPYNIYDAAINLNIPDKLREHYGINVLPFDYLSVDDIDIADINDNMYWNYGRKILQAAKFVRNKPKFDLIYITNFKCGPDSYVKHYCSEAAQKPLLMLQFDGHGNDAGALTRCEAYLDSKGFLK